MRTVCILQPGFLPWLGFFEQMAKCDVFVLYDDVQYTRRSWRNRNRIRTSQGWDWLTVPVEAGPRSRTIRDVRLSQDPAWRDRHIKTIAQCYRKAPFYPTYAPALQEIYTDTSIRTLAEFDLAFIRLLRDSLGITTELIHSSSLGVSGKGTERVAAICRAVAADHLYDGEVAESILDLPYLADRGIEVTFQKFFHPVYPQCHDPFIPYMSTLDAVFALGPDAGQVLLRSPSAPASACCDASGPVVLRRFEERHQRRTFEWLQDENLASSIDSSPPRDMSQQKDWLFGRRHEGARTFAIEHIDHGHLGNLFLDDLTSENPQPRISLYMGASIQRGKGYGTLALGLGLRFAFDALGAELVRLTVNPGNDAALRLYRKWGFAPQPGPVVSDKHGKPLARLVVSRGVYRGLRPTLLPPPLSEGRSGEVAAAGHHTAVETGPQASAC